MSARDDGGNAFPIPGRHEDESFNGLTVRDYFAARAMQGFVVDSESDWSTAERMAAGAYKWADAMLKARGVK